ncbi:MAG TPA: translation elongation factor Ts [Gemmatales bacterium]|nr:translation elongation factor Ts [Gemmatales bacterium]
MAAITADAVNRLRKMTDRPMMECKAALTEAAGDLEKAVSILRERNAKLMAGKADRETAEGRVGIWIAPDHSAAGIIEVRCESAPVAKAEDFVKLVDDLAQHVAQGTQGTESVDELLTMKLHGQSAVTVQDRIGEVVGKIRENMKIARFKVLRGGPFGSYVHFDGSVGVLFQADGGEPNPEVLKDVAMHVTAKQPVAATREQIDPALLAAEKDLAQKQVAADPKNAGKPANIIEKILEGKMRTWLAENVLVEQPFVKDDSKTVGQLLTGAKLAAKNFVRFKVGELK